MQSLAASARTRKTAAMRLLASIASLKQHGKAGMHASRKQSSFPDPSRPAWNARRRQDSPCPTLGSVLRRAGWLGSSSRRLSSSAQDLQEDQLQSVQGVDGGGLKDKERREPPINVGSLAIVFERT